MKPAKRLPEVPPGIVPFREDSQKLSVVSLNWLVFRHTGEVRLAVASARPHVLSRLEGGAPAWLRLGRAGLYPLIIAQFIPMAMLCRADQTSLAGAGASPFITYTNTRVGAVPWSIHIVQLQRSNALYEIDSIHAGGKAVGLETLSEQLTRPASALGVPVAGVNGDFYQRDKAFAGAPRGLQIVSGELISAPSGGPSFWVDAVGQCHTANLTSRFRLTWPNGATTGFGLNGERRADGIELYTPAIGASTLTAGGHELVLARAAGSRWLPLRVGQTCIARVSEIRETGNTPVAPQNLVLSLGPAILSKLPVLQPGMLLRLSTETDPALHGVRTAISGGPILIQNGKRQKVQASPSEAYEFSSMLERHPRTAIGWNANSFFLVEVDGRQNRLSVGMTLDELTKFLLDLGCDNAMNLDGGGSATLWYAGQVQNSPCDRAEREIANGIGIFKKRIDSGTAGAHNQ